MHDLSGFVLALLAVWVPMGLTVSRLVPASEPFRYWLCAGYGLLLGLLVVPLIMRVHSAVGLPFSALLINGSLLAFAACVFLLPRLSLASGAPSASVTAARMPERLLALFCLFLIAIRIATLGVEALSPPVFAWDAKQHWTKQARVFYEFGSVVSHVSPREWLERGGHGVYANMHPDYPITMPLLQTWTAATLGEWRDDYIGIPWLVCFLGLGLVFFGQARVAGASLGLAAVATYMLLSLPYLNIQIALPGYADIFLGTVYLSALAAFYGWTVTRRSWQGALALIMVLMCLLIKKEGIFWAFSFIPGVLLVWLGNRRGLVILATLGSLAFFSVLVIPESLSIIGFFTESIELGFRADAVLPALRSLFVHSNWHMASYMIVALMLIYLAKGAPNFRRILPAAVTLMTAFGMYLSIYLYTSYAFAVIQQTSFNRVGLQLYPALLFLTLVLYLELAYDRK